MNRCVLLSLGLAQLVAADPEPEAVDVKLSSALRQVAGYLGEGGAHFSVTDIAGDAEKLASVLDGLIAPIREEGGEFPADLNFEDLVRTLKIDRITAMGQSAHQTGDYWHNRLFVATGGHRGGLLSVLGGKGKPFIGPGYALGDADLVLELELNLKKARDLARKVAAPFGPEVSRELREALAEEILEGALTVGDFFGKFEMRLSLAVTLDPAKRIPIAEGISAPGATFVARLDGGNWLWETYHDMLADGATELQRDGLEILMAPEPIDSPMGPIQPLLALEPGTGVIWAALREEDLKTVRQEGGERLVGSAPFKAAMLGLPAQGNALVYSSPRLMVELSGLLKAAEQHLPVDTWSGIALASAYLPALAGPPLPYAAVLANNDDGILLASNGPEAIKGRSMMGSSGMVVALAAMATPQIFKALSRAQLAQDISGARFVVLSLHSYAMDHDGEFPPNLDVLVASGYLEDASVLTMKCEDKQMRLWSYRTGLTHVSTPDRILLYGPQAVGGKRIVACVDGSVRSMLEARFQELLVAQDKVED